MYRVVERKQGNKYGKTKKKVLAFGTKLTNSVK